MYCLDRLPEPAKGFYETKEKLAQQFDGSIHYKQVDVQQADDLDAVVGGIAAEHQRMDGLIAAAGIQRVVKALDYPPHEISEVEPKCRASRHALRLISFR